MMQLGEQESVLDTSMPLPLPPQDGANGGEEKGREGSGGGELDEDGGDKIGSGGSRWPRQETLALLKIRSDMDAVFRDSSLKGPLWEEVSRYIYIFFHFDLNHKSYLFIYTYILLFFGVSASSCFSMRHFFSSSCF